MITQFNQDLFKKNFSHHDQDKRDDSLQKSISFWPIYVVFKMGRPIPGNVID